MSLAQSTTEFWETLGRVLLGCIVCGFVLLALWAGVLLIAPDVIYRTHGAMFGMTAHELTIIHYCGLALFKLALLLFFVFPYAAIRWTLRRA